MAMSRLPPALRRPADGEFIQVRGARVHNLRNLDVDLPRDKLIVITGVSGSGKSSLAFDTIFAEGQRQYIESLSVYARQFLHQMERPDVDLIEGLQPTVSIDQRATSANPRSTVATVTEIYDYLRLLMARLGEAFCYKCGAPIRQQSAEEIQAELLQLPSGTKLMIMAPMVRGRKGTHKEVFESIRKAQLQRARVDGEVIDVGGEPPELAPRKNHTIEAVVDRIVIREGIDDRLAESLNLAILQGEGAVIVSYFVRDPDQPEAGVWRDQRVQHAVCLPELQNQLRGIGAADVQFQQPLWRVPDVRRTGLAREVRSGTRAGRRTPLAGRWPVVPWKNVPAAAVKRHRGESADFLAQHHLQWDTPFSQWKPSAREQFLNGNGKNFLGVLTLLEKEFATATKASEQERLAAFRGQVVCPDCRGARIRPEARNVRIGGKAIHEIAALTVHAAHDFFQQLGATKAEGGGRKAEELQVTLGDSEIADDDRAIFAPLAAEITNRLAFLDEVGLGYLTLDRPADTLSGGELQRVRLATGIGSGLVGVCYVLDEPSIGLHPRDNQRLIDALRDLQTQGNTVLVVEHDEAMMRSLRSSARPRPRRGHARRANRFARHSHGRDGRSRVAHGSLLVGHRGDPRSAAAPARRENAVDYAGRRRHEQSEERKRAVSTGCFRLRHRRERLGKKFAGERNARHGAGAALDGSRAQAGSARQPARRQSDRQDCRDRSIAHWPHAAEQSGHLPGHF